MPVFLDTETGKAFAAQTLLINDNWPETWDGASTFNAGSNITGSSLPGTPIIPRQIVQFCEPVLTSGVNFFRTPTAITFWDLINLGVYHRNGLIGISPDLPTVGGTALGMQAWTDTNRPDGDPWYAGVIHLFGPGMGCLNQGDGIAKITMGIGVKVTKWINFLRTSYPAGPNPVYALPADSSAAVNAAWTAYQSAAWTWTFPTVYQANAGTTGWQGMSDLSPYQAVAGILASGFANVTVGPDPSNFFNTSYSQGCQLQGGFQAAAYPVSGAASVGAALGEPGLFTRLLFRQMVLNRSDPTLTMLQTEYSPTNETYVSATSNLFDLLWGFSSQTTDDALAQDILDQVRSSSANVFATIDAGKGPGWWTDVDCSSLLSLAPPAGAQQFWLAIAPSSASYGSGGGLRNRVEWLANPFPAGFNLWSNYPFVSNYYFHPQSALLPYWEVTLWA